MTLADFSDRPRIFHPDNLQEIIERRGEVDIVCHACFDDFNTEPLQQHPADEERPHPYPVYRCNETGRLRGWTDESRKHPKVQSADRFEAGSPSSSFYHAGADGTHEEAGKPGQSYHKAAMYRMGGRRQLVVAEVTNARYFAVLEAALSRACYFFGRVAHPEDRPTDIRVVLFHGHRRFSAVNREPKGKGFDQAPMVHFPYARATLVESDQPRGKPL